MDGVHDLGGADGMGPVEHTTEDEELWGTEAESGTAVCIDLWEPYLEAAEQ